MSLPRKYEIEPGPLDTPCWVWKGYKCPKGYGLAGCIVNGRKSVRVVHKILYEHYVGLVAPGYHLHHKCKNPACCNPEHMEMLTPLEHKKRDARAKKTHCKHGHEFTPENTYDRTDTFGNSYRLCKQCVAAQYLKDKANDPERLKKYRKDSELRRNADPERYAKRLEYMRLKAEQYRRASGIPAKKVQMRKSPKQHQQSEQ